MSDLKTYRISYEVDAPDSKEALARFKDQCITPDEMYIEEQDENDQWWASN